MPCPFTLSVREGAQDLGDSVATWPALPAFDFTDAQRFAGWHGDVANLKFRVPLDKSEGAVKRHFSAAMLFSTALMSEWMEDRGQL